MPPLPRTPPPSPRRRTRPAAPTPARATRRRTAAHPRHRRRRAQDAGGLQPDLLAVRGDADLGTCSAAASGASRPHAGARACKTSKLTRRPARAPSTLVQAHDLRHTRLHARTRKFTPHMRGQHHYTLIKTDLHTRTYTRTHTHQQLLSSPPPKGLLFYSAPWLSRLKSIGAAHPSRSPDL